MVTGLFHIRINSSEDNKDNGLYALMISGASVMCVKDEEYIVPEEAIAKLNEKKIIYEVVTKREKKESENATQTQI
jgi:hypothetical protein